MSDRDLYLWNSHGSKAMQQQRIGLQEMGVLVKVERCEHGMIDSHWWPNSSYLDDATGYIMPTDFQKCWGAALGGNDE